MNNRKAEQLAAFRAAQINFERNFLAIIAEETDAAAIEQLQATLAPLSAGIERCEHDWTLWMSEWRIQDNILEEYRRRTTKRWAALDAWWVERKALRAAACTPKAKATLWSVVSSAYRLTRAVGECVVVGASKRS